MKKNNQQATIQSSLISRLCRLTALRATRISSLRGWSSLSRRRNDFLAWMAALACCAISPLARAVTPAPDGGYANQNTAEGDSALFSLGNGSYNTASGFQALYSNNSGSDNTASGSQALFRNTDGSYNTAAGVQALYSNILGSDNTATGLQALTSNTNGNDNTADGFKALYSNSSGLDNTATGSYALYTNSAGGFNTASGHSALYANTSGSNNTASGYNALFSNTTGHDNVGIGKSALALNKAAAFNTAIGIYALNANISGSSNTAEGFQALANTTGSFNIALGNNAGFNLTAGSSNIDIGNLGVAGESGKIRIGTKATQTATFIAGISGKTVASGVGVIINSAGQLGVATSSARFKEAIKPMDKASEAILAFKPVTFRYKQDLDPEGIPQFGLIAEEVEKVNPKLVARDEDGKVTTVRYEAVNAMLLNEFLKEHRRVEDQARNAVEQKATIAELKSKIGTQERTAAQQQKQIEALTATVQKVANKIELANPARRVVASTVTNNQ
jgi:uncharacterized coiled-coil protein SlyX